MARIVGILGRNGSGKDEVADYLQRQYGFAKISIGDIVRDIAKEEERFHLTRSIEQADVTVSNDGTLEQFHREIERKLEERL